MQRHLFDSFFIFLPDYRIEERDKVIKDALKNIEKLEEEFSFYKSIKTFVTTVENIEKITKTAIFTDFFKNLKNQITILPEKDLKKVNSILFSFVEKNKKNYLNKISSNNGTIYEYDTYYIWYLTNKNTQIRETFEIVFKNKKIDSIHIDGIKRSHKDFSDNCLLDISHANRIRIKILK